MVFSQNIYAQQEYELQFITIDQPDISISQLTKVKKNIRDAASANATILQVLQQLQGQGYIAASVDSVVIHDLQYDVYIYLGDPYTWTALSTDPVDAALLSQAGYRQKQFSGQRISIENLREVQDKIVTFLENNGYPFASAYLDDVQINNEGITATLQVEKNKLYRIDTIYIHEGANISSNFFYNYIGIEPGDLYNESVIRNIARRINELPYLEEARPFQVIFTEFGVRMNFFLKNRPSSRFNFLIGVLPNNEFQDGRLLITGEANLNLVNPFGTGKTMLVEWRGLKPRSPEFNARFIYPYILGLPLGIDARLNIYKNDTFYVDILKEVGIQYLFMGNNYLKAFVRNKTTNLISVDTLALFLTRRLPNRLDIDNIYYGLEYHLENLDYRYNPRQGWDLTISGSAGNKRIKRNTRITSLEDPSDGFEFASLYDSLEVNALNFLMEYTIKRYWPLGNRSTILTGAQGGWLISDQIFQNELFRIGGVNLLRGFDESALLASVFNILSLEYRYLIGRNSYFSVFWDGAYIQQEVRGERIEEYPLGFGAGLAFETGAGVFGLSYALGRLNGQEGVRVRNAKIHFGYVSYF